MNLSDGWWDGSPCLEQNPTAVATNSSITTFDPSGKSKPVLTLIYQDITANSECSQKLRCASPSLNLQWNLPWMLFFIGHSNNSKRSWGVRMCCSKHTLLSWCSLLCTWSLWTCPVSSSPTGSLAIPASPASQNILLSWKHGNCCMGSLQWLTHTRITKATRWFQVLQFFALWWGALKFGDTLGDLLCRACSPMISGASNCQGFQALSFSRRETVPEPTEKD